MEGVASSSVDIKGDHMESTAPGHGHPGTGNDQGPRNTVIGPCEECGCVGPKSTARVLVKHYCSGWNSGNYAAFLGPTPVFADPDDLESGLLRM